MKPELNCHHYTAKQARYLKQSKENLQSEQCIILADLSENYSFILQDVVQGFHWFQATLHLSVVYIRDQHLQTLSFCVISDCLDKNTLSFHAFKRTLVQHLCTEFPNLKKVIYFSDGSAAQYKNRKMINTFYHE
jgi:hypothetical protein